VILVSEDVWSADFEGLAQEFTVVREPDLWNKKEELAEKISTASALVVRNRTQVTRELIEAAPNLKLLPEQELVSITSMSKQQTKTELLSQQR